LTRIRSKEAPMKILLPVFLVALAAAVAPAARAAGQSQQKAPAAPAGQAQSAQGGEPMQTTGKVGDRSYNWTNGWAWLALGDDAKVSMVVGIEQGIVLSVRENWSAVPAADQQTLTHTAERLTVSGFSFDQVVLDMDKVYLDPDNDFIPVVDVYLYTVMELKKTPSGELQKFLDGLRKTYQPPPIMMKRMEQLKKK
jgi:hypothetical protein